MDESFGFVSSTQGFAFDLEADFVPCPVDSGISTTTVEHGEAAPVFCVSSDDDDILPTDGTRWYPHIRIAVMIRGIMTAIRICGYHLVLRTIKR